MNHCKDVESTRSSRGHTKEIRFWGLENTAAVGADDRRTGTHGSRTISPTRAEFIHGELHESI